MVKFILPVIQVNSTGWGPNTDPSQFKDRQSNTSNKKRMEEKPPETTSGPEVSKQPARSSVDLLSALKNRLNVIVETKYTSEYCQANDIIVINAEYIKDCDPSPITEEPANPSINCQSPDVLQSATDYSASLTLGLSKNVPEKKNTDARAAVNPSSTQENSFFIAVKAFQSDDLTFLLELGWSDGKGRVEQIFFRPPKGLIDSADPSILGLSYDPLAHFCVHNNAQHPLKSQEEGLALFVNALAAQRNGKNKLITLLVYHEIELLCLLRVCHQLGYSNVIFDYCKTSKMCVLSQPGKVEDPTVSFFYGLRNPSAAERAITLEDYIQIHPTVNKPIPKTKHGYCGSPAEGQLFRICFGSKTSMKWRPIPRALTTEQHSPPSVSSKPSSGATASKQSKAATKEPSAEVKIKPTDNTRGEALVELDSATIVHPYFRVPFKHPLLVRLGSSFPKRANVVQCVETGGKAKVLNYKKQRFAMLSVEPAARCSPSDSSISMPSLKVRDKRMEKGIHLTGIMEKNFLKSSIEVDVFLQADYASGGGDLALPVVLRNRKDKKNKLSQLKAELSNVFFLKKLSLKNVCIQTPLFSVSRNKMDEYVGHVVLRPGKQGPDRLSSSTLLGKAKLVTDINPDLIEQTWQQWNDLEQLCQPGKSEPLPKKNAKKRAKRSNEKTAKALTRALQPDGGKDNNNANLESLGPKSSTLKLGGGERRYVSLEPLLGAKSTNSKLGGCNGTNANLEPLGPKTSTLKPGKVNNLEPICAKSSTSSDACGKRKTHDPAQGPSGSKRLRIDSPGTDKTWNSRNVTAGGVGNMDNVTFDMGVNRNELPEEHSRPLTGGLTHQPLQNQQQPPCLFGNSRTVWDFSFDPWIANSYNSYNLTCWNNNQPNAWSHGYDFSADHQYDWDGPWNNQRF